MELQEGKEWGSPTSSISQRVSSSPQVPLWLGMAGGVGGV